MMYYRLIFKDGSHGAWTTDRERIEKDHKFFLGSEIEEKFFNREWLKNKIWGSKPTPYILRKEVFYMKINPIFLINDTMELNRQEIERFCYDMAIDNGWNSTNTRNILPQYSLKKNCSYSCVRILREKGYKIVNLSK